MEEYSYPQPLTDDEAAAIIDFAIESQKRFALDIVARGWSKAFADRTIRASDPRLFIPPEFKAAFERWEAGCG